MVRCGACYSYPELRRGGGSSRGGTTHDVQHEVGEVNEFSEKRFIAYANSIIQKMFKSETNNNMIPNYLHRHLVQGF